MGKSQAARTFSVSLSSVKRSAKTAEEARSLAPKKKPSSKPKLDERARRLLEADLEERPFLTLRQRCEYLRTVASVKVSRFTVCRCIKRMDATRKKGGREVRERDESLRAAWRVMVAGVLDPGRPVFVDECGTHTSLAPVYGYCPKGKRLKVSVPRNRGKKVRC